MASQKEKLQAELSKFNVKLTGEETVAELKELLTKAQAEDAGGEAAPKDEEEAADEEDEDESDADSATVGFIDPVIGQTERVFSKEVHGKDFKKIAKQFCETHKDKSATILK